MQLCTVWLLLYLNQRILLLHYPKPAVVFFNVEMSNPLQIPFATFPIQIILDFHVRMDVIKTVSPAIVDFDYSLLLLETTMCWSCHHNTTCNERFCPSCHKIQPVYSEEEGGGNYFQLFGLYSFVLNIKFIKI